MAVKELKPGMWVVHSDGGNSISYNREMQVVFDGKARKVIAAEEPRNNIGGYLQDAEIDGINEMWSWDLTCFTEVPYTGGYDDGAYTHYTRFDTQIAKTLIGVSGIFYDHSFDEPLYMDTLKDVTPDGWFISIQLGARWGYFAVPNKPPKKEITMDEAVSVLAEHYNVPELSIEIKKQ